MRFLRKLLGISIAFAIFLNIMQESEITYDYFLLGTL